jgi:type I restriction enzyme M protein
MRGDSLREEKTSSEEYDLVLANPPFGSDISFKYNRRCDSTIEMNFVMMMMDLLNDSGQAGIIVPEGMLFDSSKKAVRTELLNQFELDTILALPEDTFQPYAGVDANALFFERDSNGTDEFWYYDARSDYDNIKESNPLDYEKHFADFVEYRDDREACEKYFRVDAEEVDEDNYELHLKKYKEFKYEGHRPPAEIAQDIKDELATIETELDQMVGEKDD